MDNLPRKKWRVTVGPAFPPSIRRFRSQTTAYEFVREQLPHGHKILVHEWENGGWRLHEVLNDFCPEEG